MPRRTSTPQPAIRRILQELGANLRLARLRRKLSASLVAERAGMSRPTLRAIERGNPSVTLGAVANVLHSLGLERELQKIAHEDELGRRLADARLGTPRRAPRRTREPVDGD